MTYDPGQIYAPPVDTSFTDSVNSALAAAPDLVNNPSLALTAAGSADPSGTAQGLAHLNNAAAFQQAQDQTVAQHGSGWWGSFVHAVAGDAGKALNVLGAPLRDIQHQYRYLKAVYAQHGFFAGFAETAAALGAGVGTTLLTGNVMLGVGAAEAVTTAESRAFFKDSWDYSKTHGASIGRDVAGLVGLHDTNSGVGKWVSGLTDAGFDLTTDPLIVMGKLQAARKAEAGLSTVIKGRILGKDFSYSARAGAVTNMMQRWAPGTGISSPEQVDQAYKAYKGYRNALGHIAQLASRPDTGAADIVAHYPELQDGIARDIHRAVQKAPDEDGAATAAVHDVMRGIAFDKQQASAIQTSVLPSRSLMRIHGTNLIDKLRGDVARQDELPVLFGRKVSYDPSLLPDNYDSLTNEAKRKAIIGASESKLQLGAVFRLPTKANWQAAVSRKVRTFSGYAPFAIDKNTSAISGEFDYMKDDNLQGVLRAMQFSMGNQAGRRTLQKYIDAKKDSGVAWLPERKAIWANTQSEILKAAGMPDDPEAVQFLSRLSSRHANVPAHSESYGIGAKQGDDVNVVSNDEGSYRAALQPWQANTMGTFPNFRDLKSAMRNMGGYKNLYGKIDDIAATRFINNYFKPMALLSGGFGLRVAMSEAIPAAMRYGAWNMLKKRVAVSAFKNNYKLDNGEENPIVWTAAKLFGGIDHLVNADESRQLLALKSVIDGGSHFTYGVASANHNVFSQPDDTTQAMHYGINQTIQRLAQAHGNDVLWLGSGHYGPILPTDPNYVDHWHYSLVRNAKAKNVQLISQDVKRAMDGGASADDAWESATLREAKRIKGINPDTNRRFGAKTDPYAYDRQVLSRHIDQDPNTFAAQRVDAIRGTVTGKDGTLHGGLLDKYTAGGTPFGLTRAEYISRYNTTQGRVLAAEKNPRVEPVPAGVPKAPRPGQDPAEWSRLRGYSEKEIADFTALMDMERGVPEHAYDDIEFRQVPYPKGSQNEGTFAAAADPGALYDYMMRHRPSGDISLNELRAIEPDARPRAVPGEIPQPYVGPSVLHNLITSGFERVVSPIINYISREPLYFQELEKHWNALQPAIKDGIFDEQGAFQVAKQRAVRGILPQVHNTHLRSQLHMTLNNFAPFMFAQEQAYKRAGHAIIRDPSAFRKYQLITQSLNDPGFVHTDDQGNKYLMIPFIGESGAMAQKALSHMGMPMITSLPLTVQGNLASLRTVIPEANPPGTSPLAAIPLSHLANLDPQLAALAKSVVGERGYDEDWLSAAIPNTALRSAVRGALASEGDRQIANSMMSAIQTAYYHGDMPAADNPPAQQAFIDRIKNNARSTFFLKAVLSTISPLTPKVEQTDFGLRDEFAKLVKSEGSWEKALQKFTLEHGNKAISYTVSKTKNLTGANVPVTSAAVNFIEANQDLLHQHPWGAAFTVPQDTSHGGDVQVLYNDLFRNHLRAQQSPADFLNSVYSATGSQEYFQLEKQYQAALQADGANKADLRNTFDVLKNVDFRNSNPIAYDFLFGPERVTNAINAYTDIVSMFNSGHAPNTVQSQKLFGLVTDYELHRQRIADLGTTRAGSHARQQERDNWTAFLDQQTTSEPLLANVIQAVFKRLGQVPELTGETG